MSEITIEREQRRPFFTVKSLAEYLQVTDRTVKNWIARGELPSYKIGDLRRIDPRDVDTFLESCRDERRAA